MANKVTETRDIPRGLKSQVTMLAKLRREYEAHLAEMGDVRDEITRLEKRVKEGAVDREITFTYRGLQVIHYQGGKTVTVDSAAIRKDAKTNKDLEKYLGEGERASYAVIRQARLT